MIRVQNLVKRFGTRLAVQGVSFDVERGEVLGFLGPNGAGKSTTMRMITGYLPPTSGTAIVDGADVQQDPVAARKAIGYLPENAPCYEDMTVQAFLRFIAEMRGFNGGERNRKADAAMEKCLLEPVRHQTIDTLSKGYRQRTSFAQAILHDPPVLILDEPTEGLDPNQKQVVRTMIRSMGRDKVIVLSTHILEEVDAICSRVIIISGGRIVADQTPEQLRRRSEAYNAVTLDVDGPGPAVSAALRGVAGVARVEVAEGSTTLRVVPEHGQPLAAELVHAVAAKGWRVKRLETEAGRLDDVFRRLTTTADVDLAAGREARPT